MRNRNKVNLKARLRRHLRVVKNGPWQISFLREKKLSYKLLFVLFLVVSLPLYPNLSKIVYSNTEYDFYRWDIDESSIISSYEWGTEESEGSNSFIEHNDSFITVNTILNDTRDTSGTNEIVSYTVKPWDSYSSIASDFSISVNSILWANDFSKNHVIDPGDVIKIPPVSGVIYTVKKWDTVESIAKKYDIKKEDIDKQNLLSVNSVIRIGQELVLPDAEKIIPKPVNIPKATPSYTQSKTQKTSKRTASRTWKTSYTSNKGTYQLVWRTPQWRFYWGNCTYYVAQYKNVNWWWNANRWMANARAKGHATWSVPKVWAIIQFSGRGYNPRYGHVGIVMEINGSNMVVSDMNYRRLNEITYRNVKVNDASIDGYIYVD